MRGNATTTYRYARRDEAFMRLAVETLHVPTPQRDRLGKGEGMVRVSRFMSGRDM